MNLLSQNHRILELEDGSENKDAESEESCPGYIARIVTPCENTFLRGTWTWKRKAKFSNGSKNAKERSCFNAACTWKVVQWLGVKCLQQSALCWTLQWSGQSVSFQDGGKADLSRNKTKQTRTRPRCWGKSHYPLAWQWEQLWHGITEHIWALNSLSCIPSKVDLTPIIRGKK